MPQSAHHSHTRTWLTLVNTVPRRHGQKQVMPRTAKQRSKRARGCFTERRYNKKCLELLTFILNPHDFLTTEVFSITNTITRPPPPYAAGSSHVTLFSDFGIRVLTTKSLSPYHSQTETTQRSVPRLPRPLVRKKPTKWLPSPPPHTLSLLPLPMDRLKKNVVVAPPTGPSTSPSWSQSRPLHPPHPSWRHPSCLRSRSRRCRS